MNTYTLESFISFCDDMMIAEEGKIFDRISSTISTIWINIQTIFKKISLFFKNILTNINYLKTAQLPAQKSKDIITVVQNLTPRYDLINKMFVLIYKTAHIGQNDGGQKNFSDICDEIEQTMDDVDEIISTTKTSKEYKRIEKNAYDEKTNTEVPLSNIISSIKQSQSDLIKYEGDAKKMQIMEEKSQSEQGKKAAGKCRRLFTSLCEIYILKIRLLKMFFEKTTTSINAIGKNINEKRNKEYDPKRSYSSANNFISSIIKRGASGKKVKFTHEQEKRFRELDKIIVETNNDLSKYKEYHEAYSELCKMVGVGSDVVLIYRIPESKNGMLSESAHSETLFMAVKEDPKPIKILSNTQLFHTSSDGSLTELSARFYHTSLGLRRLWNTPRIYFSIGNAIARDGSRYNSSDPMAKYEGSGSRFLYRYVPVNHIDTVYRDVEMGTGSAVYVESETPIKIRKV